MSARKARKKLKAHKRQNYVGNRQALKVREHARHVRHFI